MPTSQLALTDELCYIMTRRLPLGCAAPRRAPRSNKNKRKQRDAKRTGRWRPRDPRRLQFANPLRWGVYVRWRMPSPAFRLVLQLIPAARLRCNIKSDGQKECYYRAAWALDKRWGTSACWWPTCADAARNDPINLARSSQHAPLRRGNVSPVAQKDARNCW